MYVEHPALFYARPIANNTDRSDLHRSSGNELFPLCCGDTRLLSQHDLCPYSAPICPMRHCDDVQWVSLRQEEGALPPYRNSTDGHADCQHYRCVHAQYCRSICRHDADARLLLLWLNCTPLLGLRQFGATKDQARLGDCPHQRYLQYPQYLDTLPVLRQAKVSGCVSG